ncbi:MAG: bifunctional diguanylate cyclase/phosphodiesterase, partial [Gammaproteobacteria bacterium]
KIRKALRPLFNLDGREVIITASVGITVYPDDAPDADTDTLIKYADTAMYVAKAAGRDTYRFYTAQMNVSALEKLDLENALRKALDQDEFVLHYQPKIRIDSGVWTGVEALIRWNRPGHGLVAPGVFIPVLEETGLITPIGMWVIDAACRQISAWGLARIGSLQVAVNVSGKQFLQEGFVAAVAATIRRHNIDAELLEIEITESSLMSNTEETHAILRELNALGVSISIDDFGTGYSSLAYLRRFPIDKLKIDMAFIRDITTNADDAAITVAIISMAHILKLTVIAEGVESEEQLEFLRRHGCDEFQGYYLSRPLPVVDLEKLHRKTSAASSPHAKV